jgi:hypothetical protein
VYGQRAAYKYRCAVRFQQPRARPAQPQHVRALPVLQRPTHLATRDHAAWIHDQWKVDWGVSPSRGSVFWTSVFGQFRAQRCTAAAMLMRYPSDQPGATAPTRRASRRARASPAPTAQHRTSGSLRSRKASATPEPIESPPPRAQPAAAAWPGAQPAATAAAPGVVVVGGGGVSGGDGAVPIGVDPTWWWPADLRQPRRPAPERLPVWEMRLSKEHNGRPYCAPPTLLARPTARLKHPCCPGLTLGVHGRV